MKKSTGKQTKPPQRQRRPGLESKMTPRPRSKMREYRGTGRLEGQVALVSGGDSGIGRAVAVAFAREGADVAIAYLDEHSDARETAAEVERLERRCTTIAADLSETDECRRAVEEAVRSLSLVERGIRVNAVAPGPVWTPLIASSFSPEEVARFGGDVPLGRPAEPDEIAPCFVFLATDDSAFFVGQVLHPNGGEIINT